MSRILVLTFSFLLCCPLSWAASKTIEENRYLKHFSNGDAYFMMRAGFFEQHSTMHSIQDIWYQVPLYRNPQFRILLAGQYIVDHFDTVTTFSTTLHSKVRAQWSHHPYIKPFLAAGFAHRKGETRQLSTEGWTVGIGSEFLWPTPWDTGLYAMIDGGGMFINGDQSQAAYINSRYDFSLWKFDLPADLTLTFHIDSQFDFASDVDGPGFFAEVGPRIGLSFPNHYEISGGTHIYFTQGYPFRDATDSSSWNVNVQFRSPLMGNTHATNSSLGKYRYFPHLNAALRVGGADDIFLRELWVNYIIPVLALERFWIQLDMDFTLAQYFRNNATNISLHRYGTGFHFLLAHPSDRPSDEKPYWRLGTELFVHRSEHLINPTPREKNDVTEWNSPEAVTAHIATPYWDDHVWNNRRGHWIDYVSFRIFFNKFIFRSSLEDPVRGDKRVAVRPGVLIRFPKLQNSYFYVRGEKSFGEDLLDWYAEGGWKHPSWTLFIKGEDLHVNPSTPKFSRTEFYVGAKFYFSTEA